MTPTRTKPEKILAAAIKLTADEGQAEFTAEEIIVRAFREYPDDFSLKGHTGEFPDSNSVLKHLMGRQAPLITRGWFEKIGAKRYRLTTKGYADGKGLDADLDESNVHVERRHEEALSRLLTSTAFVLYEQGSHEKITFHQFCRFAGLSPRDKWQKLKGKLELIEHTVTQGVKIGESGQTLSTYHNRNYTFTSEQLRLLGSLHAYLLERFEAEMHEWRMKATG